RDQTGQYKPSPASSFSTSVTQGAASMLMDALQASGWFMVLEREGLQNLLTERKIIRASQQKEGTPANILDELPPLQAANLVLEGGIVGFDSNVRTGGEGARYLGIGGSREYRVDQVTVSLRAVDVRTGQVLANVMTSKTIYSVARSAGVFKFIELKDLLELEAGYTYNEPAQLCVLSAIEAAVAHLIAQGVERRLWQAADHGSLWNSSLAKYLAHFRVGRRGSWKAGATGAGIFVAESRRRDGGGRTSELSGEGLVGVAVLVDGADLVVARLGHDRMVERAVLADIGAAVGAGLHQLGGVQVTALVGVGAVVGAALVQFEAVEVAIGAAAEAVVVAALIGDQQVVAAIL